MIHIGSREPGSNVNQAPHHRNIGCDEHQVRPAANTARSPVANVLYVIAYPESSGRSSDFCPRNQPGKSKTSRLVGSLGLKFAVFGSQLTLNEICYRNFTKQQVVSSDFDLAVYNSA